jgi:hypothetical protein
MVQNLDIGEFYSCWIKTKEEKKAPNFQNSELLTRFDHHLKAMARLPRIRSSKISLAGFSAMPWQT